MTVDFEVRNNLGVVLATASDKELAKAACRALADTHRTACVYEVTRVEPIVRRVYSPRLQVVAS